MSTDGTGVQIDQPGVYFLAISEVSNVPLSGTGPIFQFIEPFEISGPDGPGGNDSIDGWTGNAVANGGNYTIFLDGVIPLPTPGDTNGDGRVDVEDLVNVITLWGTGGKGPGGIDADVNDDGTVGVDDLNLVIVSWSPPD